MNRMRIGKAAALACAGLLFLFLLTGCGSQPVFDGSRTADGERFTLNYRVLNREETADLTLRSGDQLAVKIAHTGGTVDITVGREGQALLYTGKGQQNAAFALVIPEDGTYRVSVTGHQAKGEVSFVRIAGES